MSLRRLDKILKASIFLFFLPILVVGAIKGMNIFIYIGISALAVFDVIYLLNIKCPVCGKSPYRQAKPFFFDREWMPWWPGRCNFCQFDLDTPIKEFPEAVRKFKEEHSGLGNQ